MTTDHLFEPVTIDNDSDVQVITFGCRLNTYESQVMKELAQQAGLKNKVIINTCAVTAEAERQARQMIRRIKRERPDVNIVVTGCSAQINPDQYAAMDEVDRVIGNHDKMDGKTYLNYEHQNDRIVLQDIMEVREAASHMVSGFDGKARAFVQIQNGCNHRCTFCIIPYGRGNSRSVPLGQIIPQIEKLLDHGYEEIVLTGVDITDYGSDLPGKPQLGQIIRRLLKLVPGLKRLRLSSLDAVEMDEDLWTLIGNEPRLLPHLHLSLQAGDDMVLKRMKRRHLRQDAVEFCERAKKLRPDVVFGADIIAGFPTETDEQFDNTRRLVQECDLTYLHVFPYSPRPGTPAALMPQVKKAMIQHRAKILRDEGQKAVIRFFHDLVNRSYGQSIAVLIESVELTDQGYPKGLIGRTDHFAPIYLCLGLDEAKALVGTNITGKVVQVMVDGYTPMHLTGTIVATSTSVRHLEEGS